MKKQTVVLFSNFPMRLPKRSGSLRQKRQRNHIGVTTPLYTIHSDKRPQCWNGARLRLCIANMMALDTYVTALPFLLRDARGGLLGLRRLNLAVLLHVFGLFRSDMQRQLPPDLRLERHSLSGAARPMANRVKDQLYSFLASINVNNVFVRLALVKHTHNTHSDILSITKMHHCAQILNKH